MILTSVCERSARGSAADTAASPPTRTKSSISVVTNKTRKRCPRSSPMECLCKKRSKFNHQPDIDRATAGGNAFGEKKFDLGSRERCAPRHALHQIQWTAQRPFDGYTVRMGKLA